MKKLIKNEICGSINSGRIHCSPKKVNIYGYCSLNSSRIPQKKTREKKKKKKKNEKNENATSLNADAISAIQTST